MRRLLLVLCVVPRFGFASDWVMVYETVIKTQGHRIKIETSVDRDSIAGEGATRSVWWKQVNSEGDWVDDSIALTLFDCKRHTYRTERSGSRDKASNDYRLSDDVANERRIQPDSNYDFVFSAVCLNKWKQNG